MTNFHHLLELDDENNDMRVKGNERKETVNNAKMKTATTGMIKKPKGFVNQSNFCYLNSLVQSLLFMPSFQKLLQRSNLPSSGILLSAFKNLFSQYNESNIFTLDASTIHDALGVVMKKRLSNAHQADDQEDAQEFLTYILESLHWESLPVDKRPTDLARASPVASESGWLEIGKGRKVSEKRIHREDDSPINRIFSGSMRVEFNKNGKASVIIEPFYSHTVDLPHQKEDRNILLLEEALKAGFKPEIIDGGYRRTQLIDSIPKILILHLRRIVYDAREHEMVKLFTPIQLMPTLTIGSVSLKLKAIIYHHGKSAYGGHYSCALLVDGEDKWYFADDRIVSLTSWEQVSSPSEINSTKTPYLLFYQKIQ